MPEFSERITKLIARVDETVVNAQCPACTHNSWDFPTMTLAMPLPAPNPKGLAIEVLPFLCRRCGYMRTHAVKHLEQHEPPDARPEDDAPDH
jgi:C4-type Zn-finger protein